MVKTSLSETSQVERNPGGTTDNQAQLNCDITSPIYGAAIMCKECALADQLFMVVCSAKSHIGVNLMF